MVVRDSKVIKKHTVFESCKVNKSFRRFQESIDYPDFSNVYWIIAVFRILQNFLEFPRIPRLPKINAISGVLQILRLLQFLKVSMFQYDHGGFRLLRLRTLKISKISAIFALKGCLQFSWSPLPPGSSDLRGL